MASCRPSFQGVKIHRSDREVSSTKIRKTEVAPLENKGNGEIAGMTGGQSEYFALEYSRYFLPQTHSEASYRTNLVAKGVVFPLKKLSDDILGMCMFSGYLDSAEMARLTRVSRRIRSIARHRVKQLDLRSCMQLHKTHIRSLVSHYQNLEVSNIGRLIMELLLSPFFFISPHWLSLIYSFITCTNSKLFHILGSRFWILLEIWRRGTAVLDTLVANTQIAESQGHTSPNRGRVYLLYNGTTFPKGQAESVGNS
jgi:hypothetical protein